MDFTVVNAGSAAALWAEISAVEQIDRPDQIVLKPATDYVRKFTQKIDKARVVHAGVLAIVISVLLGIAAWRRAWVDTMLQPILSVLQILPFFTYLLPQ